MLVALLAIGGAVDSYLALRIHNQDPAQAPPCAVSAHWDCGAVNHSRYAVFPAITFDEAPNSHKLHIPVAEFGIAGYVLLAVLALAGWWWVALEAAQIGFFFACMLSYLEAFVMEKWCIYCVWSWGLITSILLLSIVAVIIRGRQRRFDHSAVMVAR